MVPEDVNFVKVVSSYDHTLFLASNGDVYGAGSNTEGQLGDSVTTSSNTPTLIASEVIDIDTGYKHSLFLKSDGSLWGSGYNAFGSLGNGTTTNLTTITKLIRTDVSRISVGSVHTLIVKKDGSLWGTGRNEFGELGLGHNDQVNSFTEILTSDVGEISAGGHHSLIVKTDGSLWATGNNSFGQLGDNSFTNFDVWANIVNSSDHTHDNFIKHDNDLNQFTKVIDSNCVRAVAGTLFSSFVFKNDGSAYVCGWTRMSYDFTQVYEHEYWDPRYSDVRPISSFTLFGQDFVDIKCEIEHSEDMTDYVKDKEYVNSNGVTWEYANRRFHISPSQE